MFENYRKTFPALFVSGSCGTFVAPLMTALLLVSVPVASALAHTPQPPSNVTVLPGYSITAVTTGLNFPTAMTFYRDTIWVTERAPQPRRRRSSKSTTRVTSPPYSRRPCFLPGPWSRQ